MSRERPLHLDRETFRAVGHRLVDRVADLLASVPRGPVTPAERPEVVRAAIDHKHVKPTASIAGAGEIAFFPPVTGG